MLNKYIKIVLTATLALGLSACGKTDEEKRYDQAVKAQALGCITTEQALDHRVNYNPTTDHEIKVCLQEESNRKNDIYRQQRHEQQMAYYEAEMLDELDDISENLAYAHSRPISPIAPGEYYSRIGDSDCGYWFAGRWEWYDEDSRCAVQNRRYYDYMVLTGAISAAELYRVRNYSYHDTWKRSSHYRPVLKVNNYYGSNGKVVDMNTYKIQRADYTTQRNSWEVSRDKYRQSDSYKQAYSKASTKDTKFNPTVVKAKTNDVKTGKFQASEKPKQFKSNLVDTKKVQTANNAKVNTTVKDTQTQQATPKQFKSNFAKPSQNQRESDKPSTTAQTQQATPKQFKSNFAQPSQKEKETTASDGLTATEVAAGTAVVATSTAALKSKFDKDKAKNVVVNKSNTSTVKPTYKPKPKQTYKPKPKKTYKPKPKKKKKKKAKKRRKY